MLRHALRPCPTPRLAPLAWIKPIWPIWHRHFRILAIETSCDDTAVAVVDFIPIRSNLRKAVVRESCTVTSDNAQYGGIHILNALESHERNLASIVTKLAGWKQKDGIAFDLVAVTRGPGMRSNLQSGIDFAKGLAVAWGVPLVGVHHMHAHALTPRLEYAEKIEDDYQGEIEPKFPYLSLLVSGGHTLLVLNRALTEHRIIASTVDNAIGDCLDKIGRDLLPEQVKAEAQTVSYGAVMERYLFGAEGDESRYNYTAPMSTAEERVGSEELSRFGWFFRNPLLHSRGGQKSSSMLFTFAGILSQASRIAAYGTTHNEPREKPISHDEAKALMIASMTATFEHLASRVCLYLQSTDSMAGEDTPPVKQLVLGGGVAANKYLQHLLRKYLDARGFGDVEIMPTSKKYCTDNAVMIAWAAAEMTGVTTAGTDFKLLPKDFSDSLNMRAIRKWSLEDLLCPEKEEQREAETQRVKEAKRGQKLIVESEPAIKINEDFGENDIPTIAEEDSPLDHALSMHSSSVYGGPTAESGIEDETFGLPPHQIQESGDAISSIPGLPNVGENPMAILHEEIAHQERRLASKPACGWSHQSLKQYRSLLAMHAGEGTEIDRVRAQKLVLLNKKDVASFTKKLKRPIDSEIPSQLEYRAKLERNLARTSALLSIAMSILESESSKPEVGSIQHSVVVSATPPSTDMMSQEQDQQAAETTSFKYQDYEDPAAVSASGPAGAETRPDQLLLDYPPEDPASISSLREMILNVETSTIRARGRAKREKRRMYLVKVQAALEQALLYQRSQFPTTSEPDLQQAAFNSTKTHAEAKTSPDKITKKSFNNFDKKYPPEKPESVSALRSILADMEQGLQASLHGSKNRITIMRNRRAARAALRRALLWDGNTSQSTLKPDAHEARQITDHGIPGLQNKLVALRELLERSENVHLPRQLDKTEYRMLITEMQVRLDQALLIAQDESLRPIQSDVSVSDPGELDAALLPGDTPASSNDLAEMLSKFQANPTIVPVTEPNLSDNKRRIQALEHLVQQKLQVAKGPIVLTDSTPHEPRKPGQDEIHDAWLDVYQANDVIDTLAGRKSCHPTY